MFFYTNNWASRSIILHEKLKNCSIQSFKECLFFVFCFFCFLLLSNNILHVMFYTYICYWNTFQHKHNNLIISCAIDFKRYLFTLYHICLLFDFKRYLFTLYHIISLSIFVLSWLRILNFEFCLNCEFYEALLFLLC